jgi:hypothetical protein
MLNEKYLLNYFWVEVVTTIIYIMNQTPIAVHGMIPKEKFTGKKLNVSHFRVFGYITYEKRSKLNPKAENVSSLDIP